MNKTRIGLAGFGTVGQDVARRLDSGSLPEAVLTAVTARDLDKARSNAALLKNIPKVVPLAELARHADVICECATAAALPEIARAVLGAGKTLVIVSAGGIPDFPGMVEYARDHGGRIRIASGALPGLDAIRGANEGHIRSVKLRTQLRPDSLVKEDYIRSKGFDFTTPPQAPVKVFEGTAGEAAAAFPRHFNVAITLSLGGIGFERTHVEVWADPTVPGAIHNVEVDSEDVGLTMQSRNRPSATNPRTSRMVAPSIMAALRSMVATLQVGS
jgi:aspartate dehydrogenase